MILKNWKTSLGGLLIGLSGILQQVTLPAKWAWLQSLLSFGGGALIGFSAKDATTHSTLDEVESVTKR